MAKVSFFDDGAATDPAYINTRDLDKYSARKARESCERLWEIYEPYADPEFLIEIKTNFHARYWEMYLTVSMIDQGFKVSCPKPGPDVGICFNGAQIWFEATAPTRGANGAPDQVPEFPYGVVHSAPNEKLILRYINSISEKYHRQYANWIKRRIINPSDAFVIAINPRQLGFEHGDTQPPRILQAAFTLGDPYAVIDRNTAKVIRTGYEFRNKIEKVTGAAVLTGVFQRDEYSGLSGLLCSRIDVANQPDLMGADFQFVPNPIAKNPLWTDFRLRGTYYKIESTETGRVVVPELAL